MYFKIDSTITIVYGDPIQDLDGRVNDIDTKRNNGSLQANDAIQ